MSIMKLLPCGVLAAVSFLPSVCCAADAPTPAKTTVPASNTSKRHDAVVGFLARRQENDRMWCDKENYCDEGGACCPDFNGGFGCAGNDPYANCYLFERSYCGSENPVICAENCCDADNICRDGTCVAPSSAKMVSAGMSKPPVFVKIGGPRVGWYPSNWNDGFLRNIEEKLHNGFGAMQASAWRASDPKAGQCFVIGYPKDIAQCNNPWDDGCKGSDPTIIQDGNMTFYNKDPILNPVNYEKLDWCNDGNETLTYKHEYSSTETRSFEMSLETSLKMSAGFKSKTTIGESLIVESVSEEIDLSFKMEVDVTMGVKQTTTTTKTWSASPTVTVGPRSHVYSSCWIQAAQMSSPFDAKVKINSPLVWSCTSPGDYNLFLVPEDKALWQSYNLEKLMADTYHFSPEDLSDVLSASIGGTWTGIVGQKVQCSTHVVPLKSGESCPGRETKEVETMVFV